MTKKDYKKFVEIFGNELAELHNVGAEESDTGVMLARIIRYTAGIFSQDNPRFNTGKFYEEIDKHAGISPII